MKALCVLLSLALSAQDPKPPQARDEVIARDIEVAIKKLGSDKFTESYMAREELVELGRRAVPAVVAELNKKETKPAVKRALCEVLGRVRDPNREAVAALAARLQDTDEYGTTIASAAARSLASIADDAAIPALLEALKSRAVETDRLLKYECIRALGILRAKEAAELLRKALEDRKAAAVGDNDDDAHVIAAVAADALGLIRAADAVDDLGKTLAVGDMDPSSGQSVGAHAARALQRILEDELKAEKEPSGRGGSLAGDPEETKKTLEAWKKWWDERSLAKNAAETRATLAKLTAAVEAYRKDQGRYPDVLGNLQKPPTDAKNFPKDGYYQGEMKDAWGRPFDYRSPGTGADFDIVSRGADGAPWGTGAGADLWNHDKWKEAKKAETRKAIDELVKAIKQFHADQGRYPQILNNLTTRPTTFAVTKWPEKGYLPTLPMDGFGRPLEYRERAQAEGEPFEVFSLGADRAPGGTDENEDIYNHGKPPKKDEKKDGK